MSGAGPRFSTPRSRLTGERIGPLRERSRAGEGAEEVGGVLEHQAAGRVVGVDGHPADRVDGQATLGALIHTYGREQLDRLPHVAQRLAAAGLVEDAIQV